MNDIRRQYFKGWFNFKRNWLTKEKKIAIVTAPILANIVLVSSVGQSIFLSDPIGLLCAHLAYWGTLLIAITTAIGSLLCPPLIKHWDLNDNVEKNLQRDEIIQLFRAHKKCKSTDGIQTVAPDIVGIENNKGENKVKYLNYLGKFGYFFLISSSFFMAIRVLKTLLS